MERGRGFNRGRGGSQRGIGISENRGRGNSRGRGGYQGSNPRAMINHNNSQVCRFGLNCQHLYANGCRNQHSEEDTKFAT